MICLVGTGNEIRDINGFENEGRRLEFVPNNDNTFYVGINVLDDEYFEPIKKQLENLKQIEITPSGEQ